MSGGKHCSNLFVKYSGRFFLSFPPAFDDPETEKAIALVDDAVGEIDSKREREALNYVLEAAKSSKQNRVFLVYGSDHIRGFRKLINTEFKDKIKLVLVQHTEEGYWSLQTGNYIKALTVKAKKQYAAKDFSNAAHEFSKVARFWNSCPLPTPKRQLSLTHIEFNLACALMRLAELGEREYSDALVHFQNAEREGAAVVPADANDHKKTLTTFKANRVEVENRIAWGESCLTFFATHTGRFPIRLSELKLIVCFALSGAKSPDEPTPAPAEAAKLN